MCESSETTFRSGGGEGDELTRRLMFLVRSYGKDVKTLGVVLSIVFWRFAALPAVSLPTLRFLAEVRSNKLTRLPLFCFLSFSVDLNPPLGSSSPLSSSLL